MKYYLKLLTCICLVLFAMSVVSCEKENSDSENAESGTSGKTGGGGSGVTSECVLGYGMLTDYDIIPSADMESIINEMINLAIDIENALALRAQGLSVSSRDMYSYLGKLWLQSGSFDCDMACCYRIKSANSLERYEVRATTSKPSTSSFVITNDWYWSEVCGGNKYMQTELGGVKVYFYKTSKTTKTVKYNIYPLDDADGYYIYADDTYGNHQAYFEWWSKSSQWYCER